MAPKPPLPHDVSPWLQVLRDQLLGRTHTSRLRFPERVAARTQPPPVLPEGCNAKLSSNHYCLRDGRRLIQPNNIIFQSTGSLKAIAAKHDKLEGAVTVAEKLAKTPGSNYLPTIKQRYAE